MNKTNLLSKAEMKNVIGGGCPAWVQAECLRQASSLEPTGDSDADYILMQVYYSECIRLSEDNPS